MCSTSIEVTIDNLESFYVDRLVYTSSWHRKVSKRMEGLKLKTTLVVKRYARAAIRYVSPVIKH